MSHQTRSARFQCDSTSDERGAGRELWATTEQQQLSDLAREILTAGFPTPVRDVTAATASRVGATLVETGLAGVLVPAALGGSGATLVEAAILGEAFGSSGAPGGPEQVQKNVLVDQCLGLPRA